MNSNEVVSHHCRSLIAIRAGSGPSGGRDQGRKPRETDKPSPAAERAGRRSGRPGRRRAGAGRGRGRAAGERSQLGVEQLAGDAEASLALEPRWRAADPHLTPRRSSVAREAGALPTRVCPSNRAFVVALATAASSTASVTGTRALDRGVRRFRRRRRRRRRSAPACTIYTRLRCLRLWFVCLGLLEPGWFLGEGAGPTISQTWIGVSRTYTSRSAGLDPIRGLVSETGAQERSFDGLIELAEAIEDARAGRTQVHDLRNGKAKD